MLEKSQQFLSLKHFCEPKSSDGVLITAGVKRKRLENMRLRSKVKVIRFEVWMKVTVEICVVWGWWFSNHFDTVSEGHYTAIQLVVSCSERYFARCWTLKRTGTYSRGKARLRVYLTDLKKWWFDQSFIPDINLCQRYSFRDQEKLNLFNRLI